MDISITPLLNNGKDIKPNRQGYSWIEGANKPNK